MYDSIIDYDNIPSREVVLDKGYYEGATIILNDFCYPNERYNNDYKISELILTGDEGIIQSIDALGILHVLWKDQYEVPVVVGRDTFKLKTQDIETEDDENAITFISHRQYLKNYRIYGNTVVKNNETLGVGDKVTDISNKYYGLYVIPIIIESEDGESTTVNVYIDEPLYRDETGVDYLDFKTQKVYLRNGNIKNVKIPFIKPISNDIKNIIYTDTEVPPTNISINTNSSKSENSYIILNNDNRTFIGRNKDLRNYRVYGNTEGVGDLDTATGKYIIPIEINDYNTEIILDSPLNNEDYLDYYKHMRINADGTTENITLPKLKIFDGINVLNINTIVKPYQIVLEDSITIFTVSSWESVQTLVRSGLHKKYYAIGDQLVCQKGGSNLTWDIIGFDHDTPTDTQFTHSMTLQLHDCLPSNMSFDSREALYYAENGLAAGTYNFTVQSGYDTASGGGKTYQFTLENAVEQGGQLVFGWDYNTQASAAKITSYASSTSTEAIEQVGVTEGSGGTSLGTTDGNSTNVNHIHRARLGSNNYKESAIRQFLNSSAVAGSVWTPQTKYDRPSSWNASTAGFMKDIDSDFLAVLGASPKVVALNTVTDGGGSVTINNDKFFLLSRSEVYGGKENNINEGEPYPYYSNYSDLSAAGAGEDGNRIKYRSGTAQTWWLRSPYFASGHHVRYVHMNGNINYYNSASYDLGVAPTCNII